MHTIPVSTDCDVPWRRIALQLLVATVLLLWPALLNGYPLVFADTGTYVSQAVEHHLGWDRPVFYSFFILALHMTLTTWPVVVAQALVTAHTLWLVRRCFGAPGGQSAAAWRLVVIVAILAAGTSLPWLTAELMPDLATPLLALVLTLLVIAPDRLGPWERVWLAALAAGLIAVHQSNVLLAPLLLVVLLPLRRRLGAGAPLGWRGVARAVGPLVAAALALVAVNLVGHGRASLSPYGNVFLLARSLYDGPAMDALVRHCPQAGWRLCIIAEEGRPAGNSDNFLWRAESPLYRVGGPKVVSAEANAILWTALREEPWASLRAALRNAAEQFTSFTTGAKMEIKAWPEQVTPVIHRIFPRFEAAAYDAAWQTRGRLVVPPWFQALHRVVFGAGLLGTLAGLGLALRQRHRAAGLCAAVLVCLVGNAAITGAFSGPQDRYQSRVVWLAVFAPLVAVPGLRRAGVSPMLSPSPDPGSAPGATRIA
jgi:hypothetical protein